MKYLLILTFLFNANSVNVSTKLVVNAAKIKPLTLNVLTKTKSATFYKDIDYLYRVKEVKKEITALPAYNKSLQNKPDYFTLGEQEREILHRHRILSVRCSRCDKHHGYEDGVTYGGYAYTYCNRCGIEELNEVDEARRRKIEAETKICERSG